MISAERGSAVVEVLVGKCGPDVLGPWLGESGRARWWTWPWLGGWAGPGRIEGGARPALQEIPEMVLTLLLGTAIRGR